MFGEILAPLSLGMRILIELFSDKNPIRIWINFEQKNIRRVSIEYKNRWNDFEGKKRRSTSDVLRCWWRRRFHMLVTFKVVNDE